jgi:hypothetical protein
LDCTGRKAAHGEALTEHGGSKHALISPNACLSVSDTLATHEG